MLQLQKAVCVVMPANKEYIEIANELANKLNLPILSNEHNNWLFEKIYDNCLPISSYTYQSLDTYTICIKPMNNSLNSKPKCKSKRQTYSTMQLFFINFCPNPKSKLEQRLEKQVHQKGSKSLLKAVAPNKLGDNGNGAIMFDLNTGFGQDSIMMALGGASKVHMVERDPIVHFLLASIIHHLELVLYLVIDKDNIRYNQEITRARDLLKILVLHQCDSVKFSKLARLSLLDQDQSKAIPRPDVYYFDPIFLPRTKSSTVKKNMQILYGLFQNNHELIVD